MGSTDSSQTTTATYSNEAMMLQQLLLNNLFGLNQATGGLGYFGAPSPFSFLGAGEEDWRQKSLQYLQTPGVYMTPENYRNNVLGAFDTALKSLDTQTGAGQKYLSEIATPAITNQLTAAGLGRSGAVGESLGNAATQMAIPIAQQQAQLQQQKVGFEQAYPQLLAGLNQGNMGLNQAGMSLEGIPREMQQQDFMRRQQLLTQMLPLATSGFQPSGQTTSGSQGKAGGMMGTLLPLALAFGLAPMSGGSSLFGSLGGMMAGGLGGMGASALSAPFSPYQGPINFG